MARSTQQRIRGKRTPIKQPVPRIVLATAIVLSPVGCADEVGQREDVSSIETTSSDSGYSFSQDWFTSNVPEWQEVLGPLSGQPGLHYLEIGLFEGRSAIWMLENVLTHPSARLTGIDLFPSDELLRTYLSNLEKSGYAEKATTIRGSSQIELRNLAPESFDIIYIDGSHTADDVMADAVLSWILLKNGGLLIFDDYQWSGYEREPTDRRPIPADLRPELAIDAFVTAYRRSLQVVRRGYQLIVRKQPSPCPTARKYDCTPIGQYNYFWRPRVLRSQTTRQPITLTQDELDLIERFLQFVELGQTELLPPPALRGDPTFRALAERLQLPIEPPAAR